MRRLLAIAALIPLVGCALPDGDFDGDGWGALAGDCDDEDPASHPGAEDPFDDGVDQDCDGVNAVEQARGQQHKCLLDETGWILCEGDNDRHQLDLPETAEGRRFVQIAAGDWHTCALDVDGLVLCWGDDEHGQASAPPEVVFRTIMAKWDYSAGRTEAGFSICWGDCPVRQ